MTYNKKNCHIFTNSSILANWLSDEYFLSKLEKTFQNWKTFIGETRIDSEKRKTDSCSAAHVLLRQPFGKAKTKKMKTFFRNPDIFNFLSMRDNPNLIAL